MAQPEMRMLVIKVGGRRQDEHCRRFASGYRRHLRDNRDERDNRCWLAFLARQILLNAGKMALRKTLSPETHNR